MDFILFSDKQIGHTYASRRVHDPTQPTTFQETKQSTKKQSSFMHYSKCEKIYFLSFFFPQAQSCHPSLKNVFYEKEKQKPKYRKCKKNRYPKLVGWFIYNPFQYMCYNAFLIIFFNESVPVVQCEKHGLHTTVHHEKYARMKYG